MTIMLHDVWEILRIPVEGNLICTQTSSVDLKSEVMELLGVDRSALVDDGHWKSGAIRVDSITVNCGGGRSVDTQLMGYMLLLFGSTLFVDKSGNRVRPSELCELRHGIEDISGYAWGVATLANLYRQLGVASRAGTEGIAGCLTLLQAWIYEYFPMFRPHRERLVCASHGARASTWSIRMEGIAEERLKSFRKRLDEMLDIEVIS